MEEFVDILALWPTLSALAADVGMSYGVVKQWRRRNSIPSDKWQALVLAAAARGHPEITTDLLASISALRAAKEAAR